ncbi:hypothetical protein P691DRAFT_675836 [Macrolepiota fuliginosa MF-IS2]|uniref:NADAR domain-containing protein n=1 Tax=Macrolepiota fuliginosa MF-IS2 TaxID=1400762 RepID=A0A9P6C167_9AGAR|nr:hypothetical protein P691DRAFT_675836 [Macrolepiota fuliginosa MF-IS2]
MSANGSVIEFSQTSLPDFLNHSPHSVTYGGKVYPTAMHLHEAMKFMEHKPEFAERIRRSPREGVYPLAAEWKAWVRSDWGMVFLDKMEEVLWHKFNQHEDLRTMLLKTGESELVYADPQDPYWGSGTRYGQGGEYHGANYLGKLLVKVRERLVAEGWT